MKYIPFMILFCSIIFILDAYFMYSWRKYINHNKKSKILYKIPITIAFLMVPVSLYTIFIQVFDILPGNFEKLLFDLQSIWYLPKAVIVPILLIRDIYRFISNRLNVTTKRIEEFYAETPKLHIPNFDLEAQLAYQSSYSNSLITQDMPIKNQSIEKSSNYDRRKFLKDSSWALAGIPFFIVSQGALETTYQFKVNRINIALQNLPQSFNNFKIVQISDIHAGSFHSDEPMWKAVESINALNADLVVITGDFVNYKHQEYDLIADAISNIRSRNGVFGCLGNHDHFMKASDTNMLIKKIENSNVKLLDNSNITLQNGRDKLQIAGIDNTGYGQVFGDVRKALSNLDDRYPTILLAHDPTNWDRSVKGIEKVDLMLSGHTHGGQAGITIAGELITPARFAYKQYAGIYSESEQHLYINRGLGNSGIPIRVGVSPEITSINLIGEENA